MATVQLKLKESSPRNALTLSDGTIINKETATPVDDNVRWLEGVVYENPDVVVLRVNENVTPTSQSSNNENLTETTSYVDTSSTNTTSGETETTKSTSSRSRKSSSRRRKSSN